SSLIVTNTVPPDGFVFQNESAGITAPQGSLSGAGANPAVAGDDLVWDLDALFGSPVTLAPGENLEIEFKLEVDCLGNSGQDDLLVEYESPEFNPQSDIDSLFVIVWPGDLNLVKSPSVQEATLGDWASYTIKVESSGLGSIKNVEVRDTLDFGLLFLDASPYPDVIAGDTYYWTAAAIPELAELAPDEVYYITLTAEVAACVDLINRADASFGCAGMVSVPDTVCLDTATEIPPGTATATIDFQLQPPDISFGLTPSLIGIDYCLGENVTVRIDNDGDGDAYELSMVTNLNTTGYEIGNLSGASYSGGDFTVGTVPANDTVYFSFDIGWPDLSCPPDPDSVNTLWRPAYEDQCGTPYAPPVAIYPVSMTGMPSLTISKNNPGVVNGLDTITFEIDVDYDGSDGFVPTITDTYPSGWTIQSISDGGSDSGTDITWNTLTFNDGDSRTVSFQMVSPGGDPCAGPAPGLYSNTAEVTGGTDCHSCTIPGDSTTVTFPVEDTPGCDTDDCIEDAVITGGGTAEVCTTLSYNAAYTFGTGDDLPADWSAAGFTSQMLFDQASPTLNSVLVDGFNYQTYVSDNGGAGGTYIVDLSGLDGSPAPAPDADVTLEIDFTFNTADTTGAGWQQLDLDLGGGCGIETNWIYLTIQRSEVDVTLSVPQLLDRCGVESSTLSLSKNGYLAYDLLAVLYLDPDGNGTDNYYYVPGSTVFTGTFTEDGWGNISAFDPDDSVPGELTWDFSTQGDGSGDLSSVGQISFDLRLPCVASVYTLAGRAEYNDRCDDGGDPREYSDNTGDQQPLWIRGADLSITKMPETLFATQSSVEWTLAVLNGGDGGAYNLAVTDELSANLSYYYSIPPAEIVAGKTITWNFQSLSAAWSGLTDLDGDGYFDDLIPGALVTLRLGATVDDCDDLVNRTRAAWGCVTAACQTTDWSTSTVFIPPPGVLGVTSFPVEIDLCGTAPVNFEIRNSGQTHIYNVCARQAFPDGINYIPGSSEYRYNSGSGWTGFTQTPDPDYWSAETYPYAWTAQTHVPEFGDLPVGARVQLQFEVEADCDFPAGDRIFRSMAGFYSPCAEFETTDETRARLQLADMDVQIVKEGRNDTRDPGGPLSADPIIADASDTIYWRVTLTDAGDTPAGFVTMTDTLPANVTYQTADPAPDYISGQVVSWDVGTGLPFVVAIEATVNGDGCQAFSYNTVDVTWGCEGLSCTSGGKDEVTELWTEVDFNLPGTNVLTSFDTCGGSISFFVENEGATAELINFLYDVPDGYYYD
ncbi:MAG: hypothetical protein P9M08_04160, partial [Candidatus Erginobacter occultus]|nr:hypothetical protein [Candidatus Erginobacter occultus]